MHRLFVVLIVVVHGATAGLLADDGRRDTSDLERLQGLWDCAPPGPTPDTPIVKMKISGNRLQYMDAKNQPIATTTGEPLSITITVDDTKSPKHIDMVWLCGDLSDKFLGIYMLDGDQLIMIFAESDKPRPKVFKAHYGSGKELQAFRRAKTEPHMRTKTKPDGA